jgi:hypothetical protein
MAAPTVTCPKCGRVQVLPLPGAMGRRWCAATYCEGLLDDVVRGAAMRELLEQAERIGVDAAIAMLGGAALGGAGSAATVASKKERG